MFEANENDNEIFVLKSEDYNIKMISSMVSLNTAVHDWVN